MNEYIIEEKYNETLRTDIKIDFDGQYKFTPGWITSYNNNMFEHILKNITYNALGHLRCFKNVQNLNFQINDFDACAEDSYRVMYMNSIGKWLHIPRCLYDWKLRGNSESHSTVKDNFNGNFDLAYDKIKDNC